MNITNITKVKGYISGKEWNSEIRSTNGNIFLNFQDFKNIVYFGVDLDDLISIVQTLSDNKCIVRIAGFDLNDKSICYELIDYKNAFKVIDDIIK